MTTSERVSLSITIVKGVGTGGLSEEAWGALHESYMTMSYNWSHFLSNCPKSSPLQ